MAGICLQIILTERYLLGYIFPLIILSKRHLPGRLLSWGLLSVCLPGKWIYGQKWLWQMSPSKYLRVNVLDTPPWTYFATFDSHTCLEEYILTPKKPATLPIGFLSTWNFPLYSYSLCHLWLTSSHWFAILQLKIHVIYHKTSVSSVYALNKAIWGLKTENTVHLSNILPSNRFRSLVLKGSIS
jgi:hypothetical protein